MTHIEFEKISLKVDGQGDSFAALLRNLSDAMETAADAAGVEVGPVTVKDVEGMDIINPKSGEKVTSRWSGKGTAEMTDWQTGVSPLLAAATARVTENRTEEA